MAEKKKALMGVAEEQKIYAVLTDRGAELEAEALASGVPVRLKRFVIGDANGAEEVTPDPARTALIHEVYRGDIHGAASKGNQVTFTLDVPTETGGYTIREVGILTEAGELYSVARSPDILKPTESNGAVISVTYKYTLAVSSTSTVNVIVYNDYLTPEAADKKYLQINNNLSEIAAAGDAAQAAARNNIDVYSKSHIDNIYPVKKVNDIGPDAYGNVNVGTVKKVNNTNPDGDVNVNVGTVKTINNTYPDENGNITISVPSGGVKGIRLGASLYVAMDSKTGNSMPPAGYVVTGTHSNYNDSNWELDHLYCQPLQVTTDGVNYVTIAG